MFQRILMYSPDSYGLGHFRRNLTIAEYILSRAPGTTVLAVTGNPCSHSFRLPNRLDYVKLPAATKDAAGRYRSRNLVLDLQGLVSLRSSILRDCARSFRPDLVLIDHSPTGLAGELVRVLPEVRDQDAKVVLGMRDIIDKPRRVLSDWERDDVIPFMREHYDALLLYGDRRLFDPVIEYRLPTDLEERLHMTGYVVRNGGRERPEAIRARLQAAGQKLVVVTAGGGGDGHRLLRTYLRGLHRQGTEPGFASFLVTGPLMSRRKKDQIRDMATGIASVKVVEFLEDLPGLYHAADLVISMGGYNTVAEILDSRTPAVIVPRVSPRLEQWVRARVLASRGLVYCLHPAELRASALMRVVRQRLHADRVPAGDTPCLTGLAGTWKVLEAISVGRQLEAHPAARVPCLGSAPG